MTLATAISISSVTKRFGSQIALDNVSIDVEFRDCSGIAGT